MKKVSMYWSFLMGLFTVIAQVILFYLRFGRWNTDSSFLDYLLFFLAGILGGAILIFFLNKQSSTSRRWSVFTAFILGTPMALLLMVTGGLLGWPGVLILPQIPWALFIWMGAALGKALK
jgi:hypothetical protein